MSRGTLLLLLGLVVALGLAAWRQLAREEQAVRESDVLLFEGVDPARVVAMRVENLVRDQHLVFERDASGRWSLSDPFAAPADQHLVGHLFRTALERRGTPVADERASAADLGLDPPRVVLEMVERIGEETRRTRLDIGAIDVDGAHMNVRAAGRSLSTWRDVDTTLDHPLHDFLERRIVDVPVADVVEFHRRGSLVRPGETEPSDLTLDAHLGDEGWRLTAPFEVALDPQGAALYVQSVSLLEVIQYVDFGHRMLSEFGLDPPELTVALGRAAGASFALRFGRAEHRAGGPWHVSIEGRPFVWTVPDKTVEFYAAPAHEFLDHALTRIPVASADGVSLELGERELRLWLDRPDELSKPIWKVSERATRADAFTPGVAADARRVEDLLGTIARLEIASFLPGESLAEDEVAGAIVVQAGDLRQGGRLGAEVAGPEGGHARRFQRSGDSIAALVPPGIEAVLATRAQDLWSLVVAESVELDQAELRLTRGSVSRRWVRGSKGLWTPPDLAVEARELHGVLDGLMIVRARSHVAAADALPLADPIEVELTSIAGGKVAFTVGRVESAAEGERAQVEVGGRRAVLQDQELHAKLAAALGAG